MKKFKFLGNQTISVPNITLTTKDGHQFSFDITLNATSKFGVYFLQRIKTPSGPATVIGVYNDNLWFWVDGDKGVSYWDHIHSNIFDYSIFFSKNNDNDYPEEVKKAIQYALGVIEFTFDGKFDLLSILAKINKLSPEFLCLLLEAVLTKNPQEMNQQLDLFFKEFERLSGLDIERLAELGSLIPDQENKLNTHFITDTPLDALSEKHAENIDRAALDCQTSIDVINGQIKLLDKSNVPLLYADLNSLKLNLEKSLNNLEQVSRKIKAISTDTAHLKKVYNLQQFNSLLELIMNSFLEFQIKMPDTPGVESYLEGAAKITQFLYNHGHHFFEKSGEELTYNKGKQESSGSLNLLELMYLFLLLSGTYSASSNLKACVYLKLLKALNIKLTEHENMPNSFDLLNFVTGNPDGFITLYRHFFVTEGPLKQKVEELLNKQHPILLTEFGKLTHYYAIALKTRSEEHFFAHAQSAIKLNFIKGAYYLRQALSQGNPFAAEEMVSFLSSQYRFQMNTFEMEKDLALYFLNRKEFVKARSYLERALLSFEDKRGKNILDQYELEEEELRLIQIKIDILQKSGNEQKQAIEELVQRSRQDGHNLAWDLARDLLNELSTQLPVVAFAAVVEWHKTDINKLSDELLEMAAKENPGIIAWYQNDYQVVCKKQNPDLGLILKAVKVNFAPAITDFNALLKNSYGYVRVYKYEILSLLSDFNVWQHISPSNITWFIFRTYIDSNLLRIDLSQFIQSLIHASFNNPEKHLDYLTTVLKKLSALIDTGDLMSILYAIKRVGSFAKMDTEVLQAIALILIGSQFDSDKSKLYEMVNAFPGLILALYEDAKAWNIIKSNHDLVDLLNKTLDHNPNDQDKVETYEGTALTSLSLFKPPSHDSVNSTQPQEMPMESSDITPPQ
ncbi:hypothetical protein [Legionella steelei]|uniref:hypothetical protein n=1 Tax=Legionella steelei TaxID=947033 RepID=UPI00072FB313|nr:hypothetical protein [Legionella steelei]